MTFAFDKPPKEIDPSRNALSLPKFPSWTNKGAWADYPTASKDKAEARLIEFEPAPGSTITPWVFLVNPESISSPFGAKYTEAAPLASRYPSVQFQHSASRSYSLSGVKLRGWLAGVSLEGAIKALQALTEADPVNGRFAPPALSFVMGRRTLSPVVLSEVNVDEIAWRGGEVADADLSMTLLQLPPPALIADAAAPDLPPEGEPLTERQQVDAEKVALAWVNENLGTLPEAIADLARTGSLTLAVDPASGSVATDDGTILGAYDGVDFVPTLTTGSQAIAS
jgi:hypothetical protein